MPYTLTIAGQQVATADTVAEIIDTAGPVAIARASHDLVTVTITTPLDTTISFAYSVDPELWGSEAIASFIDDMLWNLRAALHLDLDRAEVAGRDHS